LCGEVHKTDSLGAITRSREFAEGLLMSLRGALSLPKGYWCHCEEPWACRRATKQSHR